MNKMSDRISQLSPAKRALLEKTLRKKGAGLPSQKTIPRIESRESAPLSFAQERFWFLDQFESDKAVYNRPIAFRLTGLIEAALLEQTLNEIVGRHEILRTTFVLVGEQPRQIIAPNLILTMPLVELMHLVETGRKTEALRLMKEELQQPFDLSQGPLLKPILFRLGDKEHILFLAVHHIIFDGWSEGIFLKELATIYESFFTGNPNPLPDLPVQYADYAQWQRNWMKGNVLDSHISYWKQRLDGSPPIFELPTDSTRPLIKTCRGSKLTVLLTNKLSEGLKALSRREGSTLFMTLLAAFKILLHRYTGQFDIVIGTPVANRAKVEIEELIGFFVNTLVLRTNLTGNPTFRELLGRIREMALEAYAHQDLPFEKLVEEVHPERNLSYSPLFQIMFNLENVPNKTLTMKNVTISEVEFSSEISYFDLELEIFDKEDGLRCSFIYNTALFNASTLERMALHYKYILERIVSNPGQHIETQSLLTEAERRQLPPPEEQGMRGNRIRPSNSFIEFSRGEIDQSITERFEQQARAYPHRIAVKSGGQPVTYGELNGLANRIARTILSQRCVREDPIALLIEQGVMMIAAILGVLKTGKIYVPLDPSYPSARTSHILAHSEAGLILTNSRNVPLAEVLDQKGLPCFNIDGIDASVSSENLDLLISPDAPANILYTSGSTGRPKGVVQTHRNILHDVRHYTNSLAISSTDRMTLLYSCSVHGSVRGIFGALLNGASLYPLSIREEGLDSLADLLHEEKITIYHSVPTVFRHFVMALRGDERFPDLRIIRFGGERVLAKDIELCRRHFPSDCVICTGLGTSETAHLTQYLMDNETTIPGGVVPAGYPVEDMEILLLDELGEDVGFGIVGELAVKSRYLSPGYWQNPSLTGKTFLTDPAGGNLRIYRTGDLGRRHSDGYIDILGRTDFQIKVRGFRIEVAEIEAALLELDCVREAVVHAWEDGTGENRLAAYIVPGWREKPTTGDLRDFLKKRLPDTMIPDSFIILEALPLTPNGKIDRKALPAPDPVRPELGHPYVAPGNPTEKLMVNIWSEVLRIRQVGIHDNFFDLGGHSLSAAQVISRLRANFKVEIPLQTLFETPTVSGLAGSVDKTLEAEHLQPDSPILPLSRDGGLPLSFCQERLWFLDQLEPGSSAYNIPHAIRLRGDLNIAALQQSIGEIL
ncbi:MAG: amino acid adenylation domain-containing protein, partial [Nitrospirae bacterium]|nr:amino acid adenylation domain-containing protein [Nitrospirota bacterium]